MATEDTAMTHPRFGRLRRGFDIGIGGIEKGVGAYRKHKAEHPEGHRRLWAAAEVVGGAAVGGVIQGKMGEKKLLNAIPYDLALGVVGVGIGVFGGKKIGEKTSEHIFNLGTGLVTAYVSGKTFEIGTKWREQGHLFGTGDQHPTLPPTTTSGY